MKACNCTVMLTNPDCWKTCSNMREDFVENQYPQQPYTQPWTIPSVPSVPRNVKKITRTIDKYDAEGKYIGREVITEEIEDIQVPTITWNTPTTISTMIYSSTTSN